MALLPILGAVGAVAGGLGALRGARKGQTATETATATAEPWAAAQPFLRNNLADADALYRSGGFRTDPYMHERVYPFSAMTVDGIDRLGRIPGMTPQVSGAYNDMLNGGGVYRDFDAIRKRVGDETQQRLASVFSGGAVNSGLAQDTYSRALGEGIAGVEFGAWNDAQNRRLAALGMAPDMQGLDMRAAGARLTGGGLMDDLTDRRIAADMQYHTELQNADMEALMRYSAMVQGIGGMGGQSTSQTPISRTPPSLTDLGNLFSGAGSAISAGATLFGNRA